MIQKLKKQDMFILFPAENVTGYRYPGRWSVNVEKRNSDYRDKTVTRIETMPRMQVLPGGIFKAGMEILRPSVCQYL